MVPTIRSSGSGQHAGAPLRHRFLTDSANMWTHSWLTRTFDTAGEFRQGRVRGLRAATHGPNQRRFGLRRSQVAPAQDSRGEFASSIKSADEPQSLGEVCSRKLGSTVHAGHVTWTGGWPSSRSRPPVAVVPPVAIGPGSACVTNARGYSRHPAPSGCYRVRSAAGRACRGGGRRGSSASWRPPRHSPRRTRPAGSRGSLVPRS